MKPAWILSGRIAVARDVNYTADMHAGCGREPVVVLNGDSKRRADAAASLQSKRVGIRLAEILTLALCR